MRSAPRIRTTGAPRALTARFEALPRALQAAAILLLVAWVALGDWVLGAEVSFALLYLGPIAATVWFLGARTGALLSALCTLAGAFTSAFSRRHHVPPGAVLWNLGVQLCVFLVFVLLLAELQAQLHRETIWAREDSLTGLINGRVFRDLVAQELERQRRSGTPSTLAYFDLDGFKQINDAFGHAEGDRALRAVGDVLRSRLRTIDAAARLGGDEFGLLLPETSEAPARVALERLGTALREELAARGWAVTASMGAAVLLQAPPSVEDAVARADQLMLVAKRAGKDRLALQVFPSTPPPETR
jgi:diguanylate cyclase (GGDEF)-like protein